MIKIDLLVPSDDVFYTLCGHIFHFMCLVKWLERSKTCPQCREKTDKSKIHRIYFNFSNNDTIVEDSSYLQEKVDKLTFQIVLKDKDLKHYKEQSETWKQHNSELRNEVRRAESEVREKENAIHALKEQIKYFRQQCSEVDVLKQEATRLKKKITDLRNIQLLMDAPVEDVDDMVSRTKDPSTLITYISIMKREMARCVSKRRDMRTKLQNVQQELTKTSMERNFLLEERDKRKILEAELMACEAEKISLQNKLQDLENNGNTKACVSHTMKAEHSYQDSSKTSKEEVKDTDQKDIKNDTKSTQKRKTNISKEDTEISSPNIPLKSQGILALKERYTAQRATKPTFSILKKKPRLSHNSTESSKSGPITYDGFGGHSKYDKFPSPNVSSKVQKMKDYLSKPKEDNQKFTDLPI
ncbi:E3 ubiquitin-protein ligase TRAIP-like isoform X2 [Polistes fuscatus]|uniref:E3 ubiquitin-protein ligase TRAIP-like isoform X2 n=1 Tax=Polistes fuscatus TaxID=30207 RepID=UPI001CA9C5D4|nr:E3 ubiquitin-protein ligase TRAIP-like isoform X2 [Polistes fuscatus]